MKRELSLGDKALAAMRDAVSRVIEEHRKSGAPLAVWRDGKVVLVPAPCASAVRLKRKRYDSESTEP